MTFDEAITLMRKRKVVARRAWACFASNRGISIQDEPYRFASVRNGEWLDYYAAGIDDVCAKDWEVVDADHPARRRGI